MKARETAVVALLLASVACGSSNSDVPAAVPPVVVDRLPLQIDHVQRQRAFVDALTWRDPARFFGQVELADALVVLAHLHRDAAIAIDPKAATLPIPRDRRDSAPSEEADASVPPAPLRDAATLAALAPQARAHVDDADRALEEAADRLATITGRSQPAEVVEVRARRARVLETLGQFADARDDWYVIVRTANADPSNKLEGCLSFARFFADTGKEAELASALSCASDAADQIADRVRVADICARSIFAPVSSSLRPTNRNPCTR